jgi:hypothetical protein
MNMLTFYYQNSYPAPLSSRSCWENILCREQKSRKTFWRSQCPAPTSYQQENPPPGCLAFNKRQRGKCWGTTDGASHVIQLLAVRQLQIISPMHQSRLEPPQMRNGRSLPRRSHLKSQRLSRNDILHSTYGSDLTCVISGQELPLSTLCTVQDVETSRRNHYV